MCFSIGKGTIRASYEHEQNSRQYEFISVEFPVRFYRVRDMGKKQQNHALGVEALARRIRASGWHRLDVRELERKLGRHLETDERRAFALAADSLIHQSPVKRQHAARLAATRDLTKVKGRRVHTARELRQVHTKRRERVRALPLTLSEAPDHVIQRRTRRL